MSRIPLLPLLTLLLGLPGLALADGSSNDANGTTHVHSTARNARRRVLGAGAAAALPFLSELARHVNSKYSTAIQYHALGSTAGRKEFMAAAALFCVSEVPLSTTEDTQLQGHFPLTLPLALYSVAPFAALPGLSGPLRLDGAALAGIFQGSIKRWNHPVIAALNPQLRLPREGIVAVAPQVEATSTLLFSQYLAMSSSSWSLGAGGRMAWPQTVRLASSEEAALALLRSTPYSISYARTGAGLATPGLLEVHLPNRAGRFIKASAADLTAAVPASLPPASGSWAGVSLVRGGRSQGWPISSFLYAFVRQNQFRIGAPGVLVKAWLSFLMSLRAQGLLPRYGFAPCPASLLQQNRAAIRGIQTSSGIPVPNFS